MTQTRNVGLRLVATILLALAVIAPSAGQDLQGKVVEHTLKNGMRFLIVERHEAPVFSAMVAFKVGGVDEKTGYTGLAHMFEHMAFKGTQVVGTKNYAKEKPILDRLDRVAVQLARLDAENRPQDASRREALAKQMEQLQKEAEQYVIPNQFDEIMSVNGAEGLNAFTSKDITAYVESLPSNRFELWALLESQRIATPVLREFYLERSVVAEERLERTDNDPDGKLYEALVTAAFQAHPYHFPVIGWMSDIRSLTRPQAEWFHRIYYTPGNAVCALVGDIKPSEALPIIDKYFGAIPAGPPPPPVVTTEPAQDGERRVQVLFRAQPQLSMAYHKPTLPSDDDFVFDVLNQIMTGGRTSRLYTALVKQKRIAVSVDSDTSSPGARYPNLFEISATPIYPHTADELTRAIDEEIERLKTEPVPDRELQKAKNQLDADFVRGLASNMGLASQLAYYQLVAGDWRYLLRWRERVRQITAADIQRVARKYLVPQNRTVAVLQPLEASPASSTPGGAQ